jgi:hypothetical protein
MDSNGGFRVELLGPVEAWVDGRQVALGGQRPRALLAVLALRRGRVVSSEQLIDELWGEEPPERARETVQVHVSRLRRALMEAGGDASASTPPRTRTAPAAPSSRSNPAMASTRPSRSCVPPVSTCPARSATIRGGRVATLKDPDGNDVQLYEPPSS